MSEAIEQHHRILRRSISRHSGYEVKTVGDCFMVAFKNVEDAVRFALDAQLRLFDDTWHSEIDAAYVEMVLEAEAEANNNAGGKGGYFPGGTSQHDGTSEGGGRDDALLTVDGVASVAAHNYSHGFSYNQHHHHQLYSALGFAPAHNNTNNNNVNHVGQHHATIRNVISVHDVTSSEGFSAAQHADGSNPSPVAVELMNDEGFLANGGPLGSGSVLPLSYVNLTTAVNRAPLPYVGVDAEIIATSHSVTTLSIGGGGGHYAHGGRANNNAAATAFLLGGSNGAFPNLGGGASHSHSNRPRADSAAEKQYERVVSVAHGGGRSTALLSTESVVGEGATAGNANNGKSGEAPRRPFEQYTSAVKQHSSNTNDDFGARKGDLFPTGNNMASPIGGVVVGSNSNPQRKSLALHPLSVYGSGLQSSSEALTEHNADRTVWHGLRVRIGVHYGLGDIRKDPVTLGYDYYGTVVNTASRVEGVGHGGQTLITGCAYEQLGPDFFVKEVDRAVVISLGLQPLRGLDAPILLYQCVPRRVQARRFPPLRLDVEKETEHESEIATVTADGTATGTGSGGGAGDAAFSTPQAVIARVCAVRPYLGTVCPDELLDRFLYLGQTFSPLPSKYMHDVVGKLAEAWGFERTTVAAARSGGEAARTRMLVMLMAKITRAFSISTRRQQREAAGRRGANGSAARGGSSGRGADSYRTGATGASQHTTKNNNSNNGNSNVYVSGGSEVETSSSPVISSNRNNHLSAANAIGAPRITSNGNNSQHNKVLSPASLRSPNSSYARGIHHPQAPPGLVDAAPDSFHES